MHMAWTSYTCGRLKGDYTYSNQIVYNNFPWAQSPSAKKIEKVETAAQKVLDTRAKYPDSSLADLYDPLTMPPDLVKAHNALDKAVDLCYRPQPFAKEADRVVFLFERYEELVSGLLKGLEEKF
ncbi:DNA methylase [Patescibacteria group bacterium]|nr:DNA methylase [Patescibacteria group bacterium]